MGVESRPYVGTWRLGRQKLVQHTPDALVYINGMTTLPGCQKCNTRIDIQRFVTEVSVDAGCDAAGASASFTLSIPVMSLDSFTRDAQFILHPGLEVHIYERGYFPVKGLYSNLTSPLAPEEPGATAGPTTLAGTVDQTPAAEPVNPSDNPYVQEILGKNHSDSWDSLTPETQDNIERLAGTLQTVQQYASGLYPGQDVQVRIMGPTSGYATPDDPGWSRSTGWGSNHTAGSAADIQIWANGKAIPNNDTYAILNRMRGSGAISNGGLGAYVMVKLKDGATAGSTNPADYTPTGEWAYGHSDPHVDVSKPSTWCYYYTGAGEPVAKGGVPAYLTGKAAGLPDPRTVGGVQTPDQNRANFVGGEGLTPGKKAGVITPVPANTQPGMLDQAGLSGFDIENILAYPYYHVFHGVVTSVNFSYSGGVQTATVQCASMLHFWQYHQMSTNASMFGARPTNSKLKMSLVGHNFTGWHPYQIIYYLHHDTAGAAGGVAFALSQKTNQDARVGGESLFSLNLRYWQQRFNKRETKLRLHGASGELYNAAQTVFLGTTASADLLSLVSGRFAKMGAAKGREARIMEQAVALGLFNRRKLDALSVGKNPPGTKRFDLNLVEMQAFINNLGQWGQVQLFESTYESKLDIAQKVCEVTGFEFYQDVDGDFVFKPPMFNLDTSRSRVYRIEDIDIISINFDEKEPQVTYMTAKGNHFQNYVGTGTEGEWGVQGQYIDYRLVAQFGWRPGNFETAYYTDPRQMFFAAANRLDIMNAPSKSASVTIPLRPELRPGYPVFIPYLDCFYYCNSFAHSFSVGGQCTTSLQLIGKRAKFFAPGDPTERGVGAIRLQSMNLPQRPLQVQDESGRPMLAGFPNVVMALDPDNLNPLFFLVGSDMEDIGNETTMRNLLKMGVDMNVLETPDKGNPGPTYSMTVDGTGAVTFYLGDAVTFYLGDEVAPEGTLDLSVLAKQYAAQTEAFAKKRGDEQAALDKVRAELAGLQEQQRTEGNIAALPPKQQSKAQDAFNKRAAKITKLEDQIAKAVETDRAREADANEALLKGEDANLRSLAFLIKKITDAFYADARFGSTYGNFNDAATLLDLLSDKKASFTNGQLPGSYRYYSASHPDPVQQGQPLLSIEVVQHEEEVARKKTEKDSPFVDAMWQGQEVVGFLGEPMVNMPDGAAQPEATMGKIQPKWGLRVLTANPTFPKGEIIPTSEIRELMFASHEVTLPSKKTGHDPIVRRSDLGVAWQVALSGAMKVMVGTPPASSTLGEAINDDKIIDSISSAYDAAQAVPGAPEDMPRVSYMPVTTVMYKGYPFPVDVPLTEYNFSDTKGAITPFRACDQMASADFWPIFAAAYGGQVYAHIMRTKAEWVHLLEQHRDLAKQPKVRDKMLTAFIQILGTLGGGSVRAELLSVRHRVSKKQHVPSPVFPVSDAKGYEVIGAYRYGRDVDIDPDGAFDVMHRQDPLSLLSRQQIENIVDAFIRRKPIWVDQESEVGGKKVTKRIKLDAGPAAQTGAQEAVIASLRQNMTDDQLIDLHLALRKEDGDPTVLDMNLMNWFEDQAKSGIHKVPLVNAAYSLADLSPVAGMTTCSCKAAEADVLLESAGRQDFVRFSPAVGGAAYVSEDADPLTQFLLSSSVEASIDWKQSQDALRGAVPDQSGSSVVDVISGLSGKFESAVEAMQRRKDNLTRQAVEQSNRAAEGVESAFTPED